MATGVCSDECVAAFDDSAVACEAETAAGNCEGDCWKANQDAVDACLEPVDSINKNLWYDLVGLQTGKFDTGVCKAQCLGTTPAELGAICDGSDTCNVDCQSYIDGLVTTYSKKDCLLGYLRIGAYGDQLSLAIDSAFTAGMVYTDCEAELAASATVECSDACKAAVSSPGFEDDPCLEIYFTDDQLTAITSACVEEVQSMGNSTRGS